MIGGKKNQFARHDTIQIMRYILYSFATICSCSLSSSSCLYSADSVLCQRFHLSPFLAHSYGLLNDRSSSYTHIPLRRRLADSYRVFGNVTSWSFQSVTDLIPSAHPFGQILSTSRVVL